MKKYKRKPANQIIQRHHIYYEPPKVVHLRMTEHYVCTMLQRMKTPTKGFLIALHYYIKDNKATAVSGKEIKAEQQAVKKLMAEFEKNNNNKRKKSTPA